MALQKVECIQAFGYILYRAAFLSVHEACMMQMEILMKMKALVEGLLRTDVQ